MKTVRTLPLRSFGILVSLIALTQASYPCSWSIGYFHQVTGLRGTVVGVDQGDLRRRSRVLRQRVLRGDATLTLYEYPGHDPKNRRLIKQVKTGIDGEFDFGMVPDGHYTLVIDTPGPSDSFDVQVVQLPKRTGSVTVDISPVFPDCSGGHEFNSVSQ
jgi:hypothetical protein